MKLLEFAEKLAALKADPAAPDNEDEIKVIDANNGDTYSIAMINVEDMADGTTTVWIEVDPE